MLPFDRCRDERVEDPVDRLAALVARSREGVAA